MYTIFLILTVIAFIAVVATLIMGALSLKGNQLADRESSNLWMRRRVTAQVLAVALLFITMYIKKQSGT